MKSSHSTQSCGTVYRKAGEREALKSCQPDPQDRARPRVMQPSGSLSNLGITTLHRIRQATCPLFMCPRHLDRNTGIKRSHAPYFTASEPQRHILPVGLPTGSRLLRDDASITARSVLSPLCLVPTLARSRLHSPCEQVSQFPRGGRACLGGKM